MSEMVVCVQVIDRRVRELFVETDFLPLDTPAATIKSSSYKYVESVASLGGVAGANQVCGIVASLERGAGANRPR